MKKINNSNLKIIADYQKHRFSLGKADNTVKTDINAIKKLAKFANNKNLKGLNESDLKTFFIPVKNFIMRDHYASRIICFYKWLYSLNYDDRPELMKWYQYSKTSQRERQKDPNIKKELMTKEEYSKIIQAVKMDIRMSALYETLYLSGARPDEVCNMKIQDVINEEGKISIIVNKSKSLPREIPLIEKPNLLLRWLENHPYKENKESWLFISLDRRFKDRHILAGSVTEKFNKLIKKLDVKQTLILYSFRKTRATIMFNQGYDDKEMGLIFGWKPHTVIDRRQQYDLRGLDDLKNKIFQKADIYKTRKQLEEENEKIFKTQQEEINNLKIQLQEQQNSINQFNKLIEKMQGVDISSNSKEFLSDFVFTLADIDPNFDVKKDIKRKGLKQVKKELGLES
jgi:integrase